jgi:hypothetical protein
MKKIVGWVGVDSGQIVICDPAYIDSQWKKEKFEDIRRFEITEQEMILEYPRDFKSYEEVIPPYNKTMNDMIDSGMAKILPDVPAKSEFSYNACCKKTITERAGQLNFQHGGEGVAVVTSAGYGDGFYPVVAEIEDRRVKSITVHFIYDEENFEDEIDDER